jgi:cytidylate kinase
MLFPGQDTSEHTIIAIDGPAASGKSSVARTLATKLGFAYVNSGAMYRSVAWLAFQNKVPPDQPEKVLALLAGDHFEFGLRQGTSYVRIDGVDPERHLNQEVVNRTVSSIAGIQGVRDYLLQHLRHFALLDNIVMEGRDIGSTVFPQTPYKFYIDASPHVRARRRAAQGIADNLEQRDRQDVTRRASPLLIAADAFRIDSSTLTIEQVVEQIIAILRQKGWPPASVAVK